MLFYILLGCGILCIEVVGCDSEIYDVICWKCVVIFIFVVRRKMVL